MESNDSPEIPDRGGGDIRHPLPSQNSEVHPTLGEKVARAAVSPHLYIPSYKYTSAVLFAAPTAELRLWSQNGVCHVMKFTTAESNPDTGLLTQQTFRLRPKLLARASMLQMMTIMSTDSDWRPKGLV